MGEAELQKRDRKRREKSAGHMQKRGKADSRDAANITEVDFAVEARGEKQRENEGNRPAKAQVKPLRGKRETDRARKTERQV